MTVVQEVIPTSLLKLSSENTGRAVKMFLGVQKFMGEGSESLPPAARFDLAQKLLHQVPPQTALLLSSFFLQQCLPRGGYPQSDKLKSAVSSALS